MGRWATWIGDRASINAVDIAMNLKEAKKK
jgi:hypothetical protein